MSVPMIELNNSEAINGKRCLYLGPALRERKCAITLLIRSARQEISILRFDVGLTL